MADATPTTTRIEAAPEAVFAVICDAASYPEWLVGAQRIRRVDAGWPRVGTRFHHTIGFGPLHLDDSTESLEVDAPRRLRLRARMGPFGAAIVTFTVTDAAEGSELTIEEGPDRGVFRHLFHVAGPLIRPLLWGRNTISLTTLSDLIERPAPTA